MALKLENIVDVNFEFVTSTELASGYEKTVLFSEDATTTKTYDSLSNLEDDFDNTTVEYNAGKLYFDNNGKKLTVAVKTAVQTKLEALETLHETQNDFMFINYVDTVTEAEMTSIVNYLDSQKAPYKAVLCLSSDEATALTTATTDLMSVANTNDLELVTAKYSTVDNAGVLVGAYFSQIDLDVSESIKDYSFTSETIDAEDITQSEFDNLKKKNYSVVVEVANKKYNYGGNLANNIGLDTAFGTIALENDIATALYDVVLEKKYNNDDTALLIQGTISNVMNKYVTNGLINQTGVYTDETEKVTKNGRSYTLIRKNQTLNNGYYVITLPVASLTDQEKTDRIAPTSYVYFVANGGVRKIIVNGKVKE